jgi:hypothetical protein
VRGRVRTDDGRVHIPERCHCATRTIVAGLRGEVRTPDPMLPKHVRCQLRYAEMNCWSSRLDAIRRPLADRASALPTELRDHAKLAPQRGIEPRTLALTRRRTANCATAEWKWVYRARGGQ